MKKEKGHEKLRMPNRVSGGCLTGGHFNVRFSRINKQGRG